MSIRLWFKHINVKAISIVALAATFYCYEFFLRVSPSVLTHELMHFYQVGAGTLGSIVACFFLAYTIMQIPAGLLGDHYGPRRILVFAACLCAIATALFTLSNHVGIGMLTRFMIGFAASFAYIAPLMLAARWCQPQHFPIICGLIQMMGCIGAMISGAPVVYLSYRFGWQNTLQYAACIGLGLALLYALFIQDTPKEKTKNVKPLQLSQISQHHFKRLKQICQNPQSWSIALIGFATWAPISIFAELWGVPFLEQRFHLSTHTAAMLIQSTWWGIAIGGPLLGYLSARFQNRKKPLMFGLYTSLIVSLMILYAPLNMLSLQVALFLLGIGAASQCITFGLVRDIHPVAIAGTAVGFNNMAVIMGGIICQPLVGFILEYYWQGTVQHGAHVYTALHYQWALLTMPVCSIIGIVACTGWLKETHGQNLLERSL